MPQLGASLLMTLEVSLMIVFCSQSRPLALKSKSQGTLARKKTEIKTVSGKKWSFVVSLGRMNICLDHHGKHDIDRLNPVCVTSLKKAKASSQPYC
jgi:hypothetical protein